MIGIEMEAREAKLMDKISVKVQLVRDKICLFLPYSLSLSRSFFNYAMLCISTFPLIKSQRIPSKSPQTICRLRPRTLNVA